MDEFYFKIDELMNEKQQEYFEHSLNISKFNKSYKSELFENALLLNNDNNIHYYAKRYYKEIFDHSIKIAEFFEKYKENENEIKEKEDKTNDKAKKIKKVKKKGK